MNYSLNTLKLFYIPLALLIAETAAFFVLSAVVANVSINRYDNKNRRVLSITTVISCVSDFLQKVQRYYGDKDTRYFKPSIVYSTCTCLLAVYIKGSQIIALSVLTFRSVDDLFAVGHGSVRSILGLAGSQRNLVHLFVQGIDGCMLCVIGCMQRQNIN